MRPIRSFSQTWPKTTATLYSIPPARARPATKTSRSRRIAIFVDGVAMFDTRDAFYWNGSSEANGSGYWNAMPG